LVVFEVNDMTCGHCVSSIIQAVSAIDRGAQVTVDLATHRVSIKPTESQRSELSQAIREAGYSPVPVEDGAAPGEQAAPRSGCCCR
jgi:copper chaperone